MLPSDAAMSEQVYILYDSRAAGGDTEDAAIYETCDTEAEALESRKNWPDAVCYGYDLVMKDGLQQTANERRIY